MFRSTGYHLVTLDHSLSAVLTQKGVQGTIARVERVWKCSWAQQGGRHVSSRVLVSERVRWTEAGNPSSVDGGVEFVEFTELGFRGRGP